MTDRAAFGKRMRQLMAERNLSLRRLAKIVPCNVGYLSRIMNGLKPPSTQVAARLDELLGANGELLALVDGTTAAPPISEELPDLGWAASVEDARRIVVELFGCDASARTVQSGEREVVRSATLRWLVEPPDAKTQQVRGWRRIGESDVKRLHAVRRHLKILDDAHGGGTAFPMALSYLRGEVKPLLEGHYGETTGRQLLEAAAELVLDAGWMAYDAGADQQLARRYMVHALRLAHAADNRLLGGRILCALSHQALHLREVRLAVELARAARSGTAEVATPKVTAMVAAMQACALAAAGEAKPCTDALSDAEHSLLRAETVDENPQWLDFDEGGLWGHAARAYRDLARAQSGRNRVSKAKAAQRYAEQVIALCRQDHSRTRAQRNMILANTHLQLGDIAQASTVGGRIIADAWNVHSSHVHEDVARLSRAITASRSTETGNFVDHARDLLEASGRVADNLTSP
jgi:transcriptional regulator with XRE-family HTH domain